jgi:hypothetical protein
LPAGQSFRTKKKRIGSRVAWRSPGGVASYCFDGFDGIRLGRRFARRPMPRVALPMTGAD